jgi:TolB protein
MKARTTRAGIVLTAVAIVALVLLLTRRTEVAAPTPPSAVPASRDAILFTQGVTKDPKGEWFFSTEICVMRSDGSGQRRLTRTPDCEFGPAWSPDHQQIVFTTLVHPRERKTDVYVMNADGSQRRQLTHLPADTIAAAPSWSPDGRRIAFQTVSHGMGSMSPQSARIVVMDADGQHARELGAGCSPRWSPDGRQLLFVRLFRAERGPLFGLNLMDSDGSHVRTLPGEGFEGAWSPDGKHIAYVKDLRDPQKAEENADWGIYVMGADGSHPRLLSRGGAKGLTGIQWTADGKHLLFTRVELLEVAPGEGEIWSVSADGKDTRRRLVDHGGTGGGWAETLTPHNLIGLYLSASPDDQRKFDEGR